MTLTAACPINHERNDGAISVVDIVKRGGGGFHVHG